MLGINICPKIQIPAWFLTWDNSETKMFPRLAILGKHSRVNKSIS